jgi:hypothetical protein
MKTKQTKKVTVSDLQKTVDEVSGKMTAADNAEMVKDAKSYLKSNGIKPTAKNVKDQIAAEHGSKVANKAAKQSKKASKKSTKKAAQRNEVDLVFGFKSAAVARALGAAGFMPSEAIAAIHAFQPKRQSAEAAIRTYVQAGKHGVRGEPAKLTKAQMKQMSQAIAEKAAFDARRTSVAA